MSIVNGYDITVDPVNRNESGVAHLVTMRAKHVSGMSQGYEATFSLQNGKLRKGGPDRDIPRAILDVMHRQAAAILRENRGVERGRHEKNGSRARLRQEDASRGRLEDGRVDGYEVRA